MKLSAWVAIASLMALSSACSKPLATARVAEGEEPASRDYAASANDIYYAARWTLVNEGIPVASEDLGEGVITSAWIPVGAGSHYVDLFDRRDWGVTNSYYQLEIRIVPAGGRTEVRVGSRAKALVANLKSSGAVERRVLDGIGAALRKGEPEVTNLGISE